MVVPSKLFIPHESYLSEKDIPVLRTRLLAAGEMYIPRWHQRIEAGHWEQLIDAYCDSRLQERLRNPGDKKNEAFSRAYILSPGEEAVLLSFDQNDRRNLASMGVLPLRRASAIRARIL